MRPTTEQAAEKNWIIQWALSQGASREYAEQLATVCTALSVMPWYRQVYWLAWFRLEAWKGLLTRLWRRGNEPDDSAM